MLSLASNSVGATREPGIVGFVQDGVEPVTSADSTTKPGRNRNYDSGEIITDRHGAEVSNRDAASSCSTRAMAVRGHVEDIWCQVELQSGGRKR